MDRWQIALGYYHYACYGYRSYEQQCRIMARLRAIGYHPAHTDMSSDALMRPENEQAYATFKHLIREYR
jgi:hypothetical protein